MKYTVEHYQGRQLTRKQEFTNKHQAMDAVLADWQTHWAVIHWPGGWGFRQAGKKYPRYSALTN